MIAVIPPIFQLTQSLFFRSVIFTQEEQSKAQGILENRPRGGKGGKQTNQPTTKLLLKSWFCLLHNELKIFLGVVLHSLLQYNKAYRCVVWRYPTLRYSTLKYAASTYANSIMPITMIFQKNP